MAVLDSATKRPTKRPSRHVDTDAEKCNDERKDDDGRQRDLERAADEDLPPDAPDFGQRELEADREQQQNDAHFRQHLDIVLGLDDPDSGRTRDGAGDDEGHDRRNANPAQDEYEGQRDGVRQNQFG